MKFGFDYPGIISTFLCHDGEGKYMVHRRTDKCGDEHWRWDCGGGKIELYETPEQAVLRELEEEFGVVGEIQKFLGHRSIVRNINDKDKHVISFDFLIKVDPLKIEIREPHKHDRLLWVDICNVPDPIHSGFQQLINLYFNN